MRPVAEESQEAELKAEGAEERGRRGASSRPPRERPR